MGKLQQNVGALNEGDVLREALAQCERALVTLNADTVRQLLCNLAQAERLVASLQAAGADVRPEALRLETVQTRLLRQPNRVLSAVGGVKAYAMLREQLAPLDRSARWWRLDEVAAEQRKHLWMRLGVVAAVLAGIIALGYLFRDTLFPADPVNDAIFAAQAALSQGEVGIALEAIRSGLEQAPENPALLIWRGVLTASSDSEASARDFDRARAALGELEFLLERASVWLSAGAPERALEDADAAVARAPDRAEAYFLRATAREQLGQRALALQDLERTAELAQASGNDVLFATARVRIGMLLQTAP
ncbi:MAG: hypothetical protein NZ693_03425 [Thermoflexales bacterium]|nr:hypothetical protein [Thermoflexales bacterium]